MAKIKKDLSKMISVNDIPSQGVIESLFANKNDISLLNETRMSDDIELTKFSVKVSLRYLPCSEKLLRMTGNIKAHIKMLCGISLKPMEIDIDEDIEIDFAKLKDNGNNTDESYLLPEAIEYGQIDIYEASIQELLLSIPLHAIFDDVSIADLD